jgi:predicted NUDIX family phosphoesterase
MVIESNKLDLPQEKYINNTHVLQKLLAICNENHRFIDRAKAEVDPSYKQFIPYITVVWEEKFLCLERTPAQTEGRLHGKLSLGVGGHVNLVDRIGGFEQIIAQAMKRELYEELWIQTTNSPRLQGMINDDSNPVGAVHLGIHYILKVKTQPRVREYEKMKARWCNLDQLEGLRQRMETWSQILLPALFKLGSL